MGIPLAIIFGFVMWMFMTWVKWRIMKRKEDKWKLEADSLEDLMRNADPKKTEEALNRLKRKREEEEDKKIVESRGKTLIDEIDARGSGSARRNFKMRTNKTAQFTREMLDDPISKMYSELKKKPKFDHLDNNKQQKGKA